MAFPRDARGSTRLPSVRSRAAQCSAFGENTQPSLREVTSPFALWPVPSLGTLDLPWNLGPLLVRELCGQRERSAGFLGRSGGLTAFPRVPVDCAHEASDPAGEADELGALVEQVSDQADGVGDSIQPFRQKKRGRSRGKI